MLRTKLFAAFAALLIAFGAVSAWFGIAVINARVVEEAQSRVRYDLGSAWTVYRDALREMETVLTLAAGKQSVVEMCRTDLWHNPQVTGRLDAIRNDFGFDFLTVTDAEGIVRLRTRPPYATGDSKLQSPAVSGALEGKVVSGTMLMAGANLEKEADGLEEQAFFELEDTPHARPTPKDAETRGMVMIAAAPVEHGGNVIGTLYGGILLNRNYDLIDSIHDTVFVGKGAEADQTGTATIFLNDTRITTTVRHKNGNRALGTRVSREVASRVLDNAMPYVDRAFVVDDWYLTAYDPIRDVDNEVIGMLYVGILETPFVKLRQGMIWRYVELGGFAVAAGLIVAFFIAGRLARPIHSLVMASKELQGGKYPAPLPVDKATNETGMLIQAFNAMVAALREREEKLRLVNRNYMETLGFVTHELNTPIASMMNYVYLLKNRLIGPLTEKQAKAAGVLDANIKRITEMVRHYLNLSRIERNELKPKRVTFDLAKEVVNPLLDAFEPELEKKGMRADVTLAEGVLVDADINMTREVFDNLISNAIKYGRQDGAMEIAASKQGQTVTCLVRNEGEGIAPGKMDTLFKRFSRLEDQEKSKHPGTGLGLFVTKNIVEAHGGTIQVDSDPQAWTEFAFTLPAGKNREGERDE